MTEDENLVTAHELYEEVFEGYDNSKEKNRIRKIFDQESDFNKRLCEFMELVNKHVPDLEEELEKLGFDERLRLYHSPFVTPDYTDYYSNENGDNIKIVNGYGSMVVDFNGKKKTFQSKYLGENEREFLRWLKYRI